MSLFSFFKEKISPASCVQGEPQNKLGQVSYSSSVISDSKNPIDSGQSAIPVTDQTIVSDAGVDLANESVPLKDTQKTFTPRNKEEDKGTSKNATPKEINIIFKSKYGILSNFAKTPFDFNLESIFSASSGRLTRFGSVEAFVQAIKFPCPGEQVSVAVAEDRAFFMKQLGHHDLKEYQAYWLSLASYNGLEARKYREVSIGIRNEMDDKETHYFYALNQRFDYDSPMRLLLIEEALRQKFLQNRIAMKMLRDTRDAILKHELPSSKAFQNILSNQEFCAILEKIRAELLA